MTMTMLAIFCGVNIWFGWNYMYVHSCYLHNADNEMVPDRRACHSTSNRSGVPYSKGQRFFLNCMGGMDIMTTLAENNTAR